MPQFNRLLEPGKIGKLQLKNRMMLSPMLTRYTVEGKVSQQMIDYYAERGLGGAGLLVVEAAYSRPGGYPGGRMTIGDDNLVPALKKLTDGIHRSGAMASIQVVIHRGRGDDVDPASSSEFVNPMTGVMCRAVTLDDIKRLLGEYGNAARRVREAGFDCLMIHTSGGYLVTDFLSKRVNKRTDQYGGDLKNRARFALEMIAAVKRNTGADFPVIVRVTCDERTQGGIGIEDAAATCKLFEEAGVDAIDVVSGAMDSYQWVMPYMYQPAGSNVPLAQQIKKAVKIPVCVSGKITDPVQAEDILKQGKADFINLGRALIADPYFPNKVKAGKIDEICKCIVCLRCAESILKPPGGAMVCTVNPTVGREPEFKEKFKPATKKKKVLVIGGGPGGMEAAMVAAQRGHDVTLWDKDSKLGGQLKLAIVPPGKDDLKNFPQYLAKRLDALKVKVVLGKEATVKAVSEFAPDAVVVANGSKPLVPKIKGIESRKTLIFRDVLSGKSDTGKKVIVIGGGFIGCEVADYLAEKGKDVTIIEILPQIASELFFVVVNVISQVLRDRNVRVFTGVKEEEITGKGLDIVDKDGKRISLEADDIVIAAGSVADKSLYESLKGKVPELYEVGDCAKARRIQEAVFEGATVGCTI